MKGKKKEDLDINTLPEVHAIVVSLNQLAKESNAKRTRESILKTKRTDFILATREDLKNLAKEKGLFAPIDDKKKDKATSETLPKEATPVVMAEAFTIWIDDQVLNRRLEKKEMTDALEAGKSPPNKKKDDKKKPDPKKKAEEEVEEVEEHFMKDYELALVIEGYPETREEMIALGKTKGGIDFLVNLETHIHHKKKERNAEVSEGQVIQEEDEQAEQDETVVSEIPEAKMTNDEFDHVEGRRAMKNYLEEAKRVSLPKSRLRNAVGTVLNHEVIVEDLDKTWDKVKDNFFKLIGELSLMKKEYTDWLKSVSVKPLLTPKVVPKPIEELKEEVKKDDKKKPDLKKDDKKAGITADKRKEEDSHNVVEPLKPEPPKGPAYIEAKDLLDKMENRLSVKLEYLRAVNCLDIFAEILDKHKLDYESTRATMLSGQPQDSAVKTDPSEIDSFLDDIFNQVSSGNIGTKIKIPKSREEMAKDEAAKALKSFENKGIYSIHDKIGINKRGNGVFGKAPLEELETSTFEHLNTPGIHRYNMPTVPKMSSHTRRYNLGQINSFHKLSEPELQRRLILKEFETTLGTSFPQIEWNFFNRVGGLHPEHSRKPRHRDFFPEVP